MLFFVTHFVENTRPCEMFINSRKFTFSLHILFSLDSSYRSRRTVVCHVSYYLSGGGEILERFLSDLWPRLHNRDSRHQTLPSFELLPAWSWHSSMHLRIVSRGPQSLLLQLLLIHVTSTSGSIVMNSQPKNKFKVKSTVDEIENWEEAELLQMSAKFSPKYIRRVKRDDG